ncbi:hypothetical protein Celal_0822 [Cellulophaga algicola DSM 14237]|uniref:Uncharacterized protein n=1 Tax=Cellulophaga algicola (strain DSM 14237 / IC166 / ACAM 630) TaxID=688270 RepID=E6XEV0_CELAD|nr:hypothetical protein [Cellulophaga algicola]ADV48152.1 hypothetical protein Celal_0822 [Cellulophaga algicola DSM 14237]
MIEHDDILVPLIVIIILAQIIVFTVNLKKIWQYKKAIENSKKFKLIDVSIPEKDISRISVDEAISNYSTNNDASFSFYESNNGIKDEVLPVTDIFDESEL